MPYRFNPILGNLDYYEAAASAAGVSDAAYAADWDGVTTIAPSKNAVYDKIQTLGGAGANTALSNLAAVAINLPLLPGADNMIALGNLDFNWADLYLGSGSVIYWADDDLLLTHTANTLTLTGGILAATLTGNVTGNCSGSSGSCTGNAATADTATLANTVAVLDTNSASCYVGLFEAVAGSLACKTDVALWYSAGATTLTCPTFAGALTGNVTGNCSGSSGTCTGNAGTVTNGVYTTSQVTVLAATAVGDKDKYLHSNAGTGALEWVAVGVGATAWDDVGDPDADISISVAGFETLITSTLNEAAHTVWTIYDSTADLTAAVTLLKLTFNDNGDADGTFLNCLDNNSTESKFSIGADGNTLIAGTLGVTGAITGNVTGNCSGTAATVTGAAQASITTCANLVSIGTITTGVWQGTTIKANYLQQVAADLGDADINLDFSNTNVGNVTNLTLDGTITATFSGNLTGNVTGNCSGSALTVTQAAQGAITSLGTLTTLTVDDITINANTISSAGASTLAITPTAGQVITFDGTVTLDAGVIAGVTSLAVTQIELGAAADTTITRSGAGAIQVEGVQVLLSGTALGTPASGTLTNCTGLPAANVVAGTFVAAMEASDHGAAATDQIINVCYGTGAAPAANTTTEGALYITYTA